MNILFWSGGKDAYLALLYFRKAYPDADVMLLTTYTEAEDTVPYQNIALEDIEKQSDSLNLELVKVPLPPDCPNAIYLKRVEKALAKTNPSIEHLIFGDCHLQDIRQWREEVFSIMGYKCIFPIWNKSIHDLLPVLFFNPITITISAVNEEFRSLISVGESYDQKFVAQLKHLSKEIDPMGENGEFHTKIIFKDSYR